MLGRQTAALQVLDIRDGGVGITTSRGRSEAVRLSPFPTTLADLITAIQDVVGPEEDELVVATVRHLLRSGLLTRRGTRGVAERA